MNAWSAKLTRHVGTNNGPLQAGWAAQAFTRAAEIVRHTSTRWASADVTRFSTFLRNVFLPLIDQGWPWGNGNWDLTMIDATMGIAIFTDDKPLFDSAVTQWKNRVPAYIYSTADGEYPVRPKGTNDFASNDALLKNWSWPTKKVGTVTKPLYPLVNGLSQETCRDFNHVGLGLTSLINVAETARVQGVDLYNYSNFGSRITQSIELHSKYLNGATIPSTLCGGESVFRNAKVGFLDKSPYAYTLNFQVAYNHYANRLGQSLPQTALALTKIRANGKLEQRLNRTATFELLSAAAK